jgi:hypothetical protein
MLLSNYYLSKKKSLEYYAFIQLNNFPILNSLVLDSPLTFNGKNMMWSIVGDVAFNMLQQWIQPMWMKKFSLATLAMAIHNLLTFIS